MMPFVSVICPTYNESGFISSCLESILSQDYPRNLTEILIVDGRSEDNTRKIVLEYSERNSCIKLIDNPYRIVSHALNIGIRESVGEIILRIDAHCKYPDNYISCLVEHLVRLNADNVGGIWETRPGDGSNISLAIALGSSHFFGVGNSIHKIGTRKIRETDTVPFGCYRREIFERIGLFDPDLIRNQDDEFNARIKKFGGKIYIIPDLIIYYFARNKVAKVAQMYFQYGLFKPLVAIKIGAPTTIRQFFPSLFLLAIFFGVGLSIIYEWVLWVTVVILSLYLILAVSIAFLAAVKHSNIFLLFLLPYIFIVIHFSYGWGYLFGIVKYVCVGNTGFNAKFNR